MRPVHEALYVQGRQICIRQTIWHNDGTAAINHTAYFCSVCGEVWGRRLYVAEGLSHRVDVRPCEAHGGGSLVFGELEWDHILQELPAPEHVQAHEVFYPLSWLAYELFLIVRRYP